MAPGAVVGPDRRAGKRGLIKKTAIGNYTGIGSLSKEGMEEKVKTALNRSNTSWGF
jgi:hypothetical protein